MRKGAYCEKRVRKVRFNESVAQCVLVDGGVRVLSDTRLHELDTGYSLGARRRRWEYNKVVTAQDIEAYLPVETQQVVNGVIVGENEVVDVPGETLVLLEDTTVMNYVLSSDGLTSKAATETAAETSSDNEASRKHKSLYNPTFLFESDEDDSDTETEEEPREQATGSNRDDDEIHKIALYRHTSDDSTRVNSITPLSQLSQTHFCEHSDT